MADPIDGILTQYATPENQLDPWAWRSGRGPHPDDVRAQGEMKEWIPTHIHQALPIAFDKAISGVGGALGLGGDNRATADYGHRLSDLLRNAHPYGWGLDLADAGAHAGKKAWEGDYSGAAKDATGATLAYGLMHGASKAFLPPMTSTGRDAGMAALLDSMAAARGETAPVGRLPVGVRSYEGNGPFVNRERVGSGAEWADTSMPPLANRQQAADVVRMPLDRRGPIPEAYKTRSADEQLRASELDFLKGLQGKDIDMPTVAAAVNPILKTLNRDHGLTMMRDGVPKDPAVYAETLLNLARGVRQVSAEFPKRPVFGKGIYIDHPRAKGELSMIHDSYGPNEGISIPAGATPDQIAAFLAAQRRAGIIR